MELKSFIIERRNDANYHFKSFKGIKSPNETEKRISFNVHINMVPLMLRFSEKSYN